MIRHGGCPGGQPPRIPDHLSPGGESRTGQRGASAEDWQGRPPCHPPKWGSLLDARLAPLRGKLPVRSSNRQPGSHGAECRAAALKLDPGGGAWVDSRKPGTKRSWKHFERRHSGSWYGCSLASGVWPAFLRNRVTLRLAAQRSCRSCGILRMVP